MKMQHAIVNLATLATMVSMVACKGKGASTYGSYSSPLASAQQFVDGLNSIEQPNKNASYIELNTDETYRSAIIGQDDWFVIYDDKFNEHKAVSLQYIRSIVYYDYYSNTSALAEEFRHLESLDISAGQMDGDYWGDDYEVVDYSGLTNSYWGRNSGFEYEDGVESSDVNLKTAEAQQKAFIAKAAKISYHFNVNIETSLSLVTLGEKVEKMVSRANGEMTTQDQAAFANDLSRLTGATLADVMAASKDANAKAELMNKIADKIGTTPANLENKLLPELLGVNL